MATLRRILRLFRVFAYIDFMMLTRDLKTFLFWVVSDTVLNIAGVTGMILLAAKFNGIGVWSQGQIMFLLGYAMTVSSLMDLFFNSNIAYISRRIGRGQLDHILVQPQPLWMSLLTWATVRAGVIVTPGWLFFLGLNLLSSILVILAFSFFWGSLAFWSPRAAEEICSPIHALLNQLRVYPLDRMNRVLTSSLMTILPVGLVAWYPCRALLGLDATGWGQWGTFCAGLAFSVPALWVFRRGLKQYERTGSQRYLNHGHRR